MQSFYNNLFADADSDYNSADYVIFGVPFDATTSYKPGTRDAPFAVRQASYNIESYFPFYDLEMTDISVHDFGDMFCDCIPENVKDQVFDTVSDIVKDKKIPVMLGGEHSVTVGAVKAVNPKWYVVCDAHLDLQNEYRGSMFNHDCVTARVFESVKNIIIIGARSGCREEFEFARENFRLFTADEVLSRGIKAVLEDVKNLIGDDSVYLSVDADAIDCCFTPGLGTPEPFGLSPLDIREVIRAIAGNAVAFDYVEVLANDSGQTAMTAAHMIREFIAGNFIGKRRD